MDRFAILAMFAGEMCALIINFKVVHMKLKIVALAISVE
jgi:hypothetical protein